ncbi:enoyl-CoA hydratase/isomerase family protein [Alsobacter sp. R-9]
MGGETDVAVGADAEAVCTVRGAAGHILLNRPKALNALTHGMVRTIHAALDAWADDPAIRCVVVEGAGDRAFCAGGDIRVLHDLGRAGKKAEALSFWRDEYELNIRIRRYPKPYVALVDGIVMGGGVGVSLHGSHRVAGERYSFAMPEVGIGFFPDVGATHALPLLPGQVGRYLALTGQRIGAADAVGTGLATAAVASGSLAGLVAALSEGQDVDTAIAACAPSASVVALGPAERAVIARCFGHDSIAAILAALDADASGGSSFAAKTVSVMRSRSPLSLSIALEQMRRGAAMTFEEAMRTEFRIVSRMLDNADFYEGVRAAVIDKDQSPRWSPATLDAVSSDRVAAFLAPLADELVADGRLR